MSDELLETGLLDPNLPPFTVTVTDGPLPPPPVTLPESLGANELTQLALEIATNMREVPDLLKQFGLTPQQYERIQDMPFFQKVLAAAITDWEGMASTEKRIRLKAALALEAGLPMLASRMMAPKELLSAAVETGKLLAKLGGVGEADKAVTQGEKFAITINLGADTQLRYEKDVTPVAPQRAPTALQIDSEGPGDRTPVRSKPEG